MGELAITVGVVLLLFVAWQLGFVGVVESNRQSGVVAGLEQDFGAPHPTQGGAAKTLPPTVEQPTGSPTPGYGDVFAVLRIPRLGGPTWAKPVYQGVSLDVLANGLGHYPSTQ